MSWFIPGSVSQLGIGPTWSLAEVQQGGWVADFWSGAFQNAFDIYAVKHDPAGDIHLRVAVVEMTGLRGGLNPGEVGIWRTASSSRPSRTKWWTAPPATWPNRSPPAARVLLYGIYFDNDLADLKPQSKPTLDEVGKLMTGDPALKLKVVGHTDNLGTAEHNLDLSTRRAQAVTGALVHDYNIATERLTPIGAGATQPVASNDTEEGRAKNRRVELVKISTVFSAG